MTDLYGNIPISGGKERPSSPSSSKPRQEKRPAKRPTRPTQKSSKPPRQGKHLILPGIILFFLAAYYGATALLLPAFLQKKFPAIFHETTGLHLTIANARFNPLTNVLLVNEAAIDTSLQDGERQELLAIDRLAIDFNIIELSKGNIVTESLDIQGARLNVKRLNDKTYTISSFLPPGYRGDAAEEAEFFNFQQLPFQYSLNNITIDNSSIGLQDLVTGKKHQVEKLRLSLPTIANYRFDAGNYIQPTFSAVINGSPINLVSSTDMGADETSSQSTKIAVNLADVDLPLYAEYLPVALPVILQQGKADIQLEVSFLQHSGKPSQLNLDYQAEIEQARLASRDGSLTLKTPTLQLEGTLVPLESKIHITNLLVRDPVCTIKNSFSDATLDSLFFKAPSGNGSPGFFKLPALTAALVIADNGKVIIESDNTSRVLHPVQLSMRNFANNEALKSDTIKENGSFRLSAESETDFSTFSWQGHFVQTVPTGNVTINNMAAEQLLRILAPDTATAAKGVADIRGRLAVHRAQDAPVGYSFDKGSIQFSELSLMDGETTAQDGAEWLHSSSTRITAVTLDNTTINVGNIFVEGAAMHIGAGAPPPLLQELFNSPANRLEGIDFKGNIDIVRQRPHAPTLKLRDVHLQANKLARHNGVTGDTDGDTNGDSNGDTNGDTNAKANNFAFTGATASSGAITAKGHIGRAPLRGTIDIAFSRLPLSMLLTLPESAPYTISSDSTVNGRGTYTLESTTFKGAVDIAQGIIQEKTGNRRYSFDRAILAEFSMDQANSSYRGAKIIVKNIDVQGENVQGETAGLRSDGASLSSFSLDGMNLKLGDLSLARAALTLRPDFAKDIVSFVDDIAIPIQLDRLEMFGTVDVLRNDQQPQRFIEDFTCTLGPLQDKESSARDAISLTATFHDQGKISATGGLSLGPLQSKLRFTLDNVQSNVFAILAPEALPFPVDAALYGNIAYSYPEDSYSGTLKLQEGQLLGSSGDHLAGFTGAVLQDFTFSKKPFSLHASALELQEPETSFTATNDHFIGTARSTIRHYLGEQAGGQRPEDTPKMAFDNVVLENATVHYRDVSLSPPWQVELEEMDGTLHNFHLEPQGEKIEYALQGAIADGGFDIDGTFAPSADHPVKHPFLRFNAIPLQSFSPLISTGFDISPDKAIVNLAIHDNADGKNQSATIGIKNLKATDPGSTTGFTIALLSGQENRLSTVMPLKSPKQSLHSQIRNHFQKLLVKCSVSPYLLLEKPFKDLHEDTQLLFAPGQSVVSAKNKSILQDFAALLKKHPHLKIIFRAVVQRSADGRVLKQQLLEQEKERVREANRKLLRQWQQQPSKNDGAASDDTIAVEDIEEEELHAFTPVTARRIVITDDMLNQLAQERTEQIHRFLMEQQSLPADAIGDLHTVSIVDTLDLPEIEILLSHDQATHTVTAN